MVEEYAEKRSSIMVGNVPVVASKLLNFWLLTISTVVG